MAQETSLYVISNGLMNVFPENKRSQFINRLVKPLSQINSTSSYYYTTLDSVTIENSIIQYHTKNEVPDIVCFNRSIEDQPDQFIVPEIYFESILKFYNFLKSNCIGNFLKVIDIKHGKFTTQSNGKYTFISIRFFNFLKLDKTDNLPILGKDWMDGRFKKYYEKYYVIESSYFFKFHASQTFDLSKNLPRLMKIVSPNIKQYISGGGYTNVLATFPFDHSKRTTFFVRKVEEYFILNTEFLPDISIHLIDETGLPVRFTLGPPSIVRINVKEMSHFLKSFHIQISSIDSNDVFPDNKISNSKANYQKV